MKRADLELTLLFGSVPLYKKENDGSVFYFCLFSREVKVKPVPR